MARLHSRYGRIDYCWPSQYPHHSDKSQLRLSGHVARMPDNRLSKKLLYGELQNGKRFQGGQKKRFKDTLKVSLKAFNICHSTWEQTAQDRIGWRVAVNGGSKICETRRISAAEQRRQARKNRSFHTGTIHCRHCQKHSTRESVSLAICAPTNSVLRITSFWSSLHRRTHTCCLQLLSYLNVSVFGVHTENEAYAIHVIFKSIRFHLCFQMTPFS